MIQNRKDIWNRNEWLKDALGLDVQSDGIHYCLPEYYAACQADLKSAKESSYPPDFIPELEQAVNEISLIFMYGLPIPN